MEEKKKTDLKTIPNVGKATERDLAAMGYSCAEDLKGKRAEELYAEECALRGETLDRCQLYLLRSVEYFVNAKNPDRKKCKWWFWKDEYALPAPCGAVCAECGRFPEQCGGCRTIHGRVYWLEFTGGTQCPVYECCAEQKRLRDCGGCENLPCSRFTKDPTLSDEQNEENLKKMIGRLKKR